MAQWINRLYAFLPIGQKVNANNFCKNNFPNADFELKTFEIVEYQVNNVTTHLGANCALTATITGTLAPLKNLAGALWAIVDNDDLTLKSTNIAGASGKTGQVYTFQDAVTDTGLTRKPETV